MLGNNRILFISPSAYPFGGIATWLDYLLPGLQERGWQALLGLVSGHFHNVSAYLDVHPWPAVVEIANPSGTHEGRVRSLMKSIVDSQPDIIVSVNVPDVYAAVERLRKQSKKINPHLVMTIHAIQADLIEDAKLWAKVLDSVVCTNRLACRLVEESLSSLQTPVHYAPYGVKLPDAPEVEGTRKKPDVLKIAYSGRLDEFQKRAQDIPDILNALERRGVAYEFMVAGGGPYEPILRQQLQQQIQQGSVRFLGILDFPTLVDKVYRYADVLLVTSYWETGPIVIWEAMAYGLPVVSSRYIGSGQEGSLHDGVNCLLYPIGDVEQAAARLAELRNPKLADNLIAEARHLLEQRYTIDQSVSTWHECLQAVQDKPVKIGKTTIRTIPPDGRLDRLVGTTLAEDIRRLLGKGFQHYSAGGEWPHTHSHVLMNETGFWQQAQSLEMQSHNKL